MVPFAGGLLVGVSVFGLFPELVSEIGWGKGLLLFAAGYLVLLGINHYVIPICPSCAHDHDHETCATVLHGFAGPLVLAAAVHSSLDGWSIVTAQFAGPLGVRLALPMAVVLHKIPEGIALGAILCAAVVSRRVALAWCLLAEGVTLAGGRPVWCSRPSLVRHGLVIHWPSPADFSSILDSTPCMASGSGAA
jgi:zinc transporter ZupT